MNKLLKGYDLKHFKVLAIWPQNSTEAVAFMKARCPSGDPTPWCVEYRGNGHYFATPNELFDYVASRRWKTEALEP